MKGVHGIDLKSRQLELVGVAEIAARLDVGVSAVSNWQARGLLPRPAAELACGRVWRWRVVKEWAEDTGRIKTANPAKLAEARAFLPIAREQAKANVIAEAERAAWIVDEPLRVPPTDAAKRGGEWDWWYQLDRDTRRVLAQYMTETGGAPDQVADVLGRRLGIEVTCTADVEQVMSEWVRLVLVMHAARSFRLGRGSGGVSIVDPDGYDVGALFGVDGAAYLVEYWEEFAERHAIADELDELPAYDPILDEVF